MSVIQYYFRVDRLRHHDENTIIFGSYQSLTIYIMNTLSILIFYTISTKFNYNKTMLLSFMHYTFKLFTHK